MVTIGAAPGKGSQARVEAARATQAAMQSGADVIYQGLLFDGEWLGRPDFLLKFPGESRLGSYHYAVLDAKLAREAKARAVLQLRYTGTGASQGATQEYCFIAPAGGDEVQSRGCVRPTTSLTTGSRKRASTPSCASSWPKSLTRSPSSIAACVAFGSAVNCGVEPTIICRWWRGSRRGNAIGSP